MDPTCGLVDKFRDLVLDQIWEQLRYLVHYHRNIEQLNKRLEELTLERISIQHQIDEAKNNAEKVEEKVLKWLDEVNKLVEEVEQLRKESQGKSECSITSYPNPWLRYKLSKRAKAMTQQVVEIHGKGNFGRVWYRDPPQLMLGLTTRVSSEGIGSRVQIKSQIMEALRNPSVNMVGLCGLGGVGKTTIAKDVAMEKEIQKMFKTVIMATVSQDMNTDKIQDQIIEKLGMQLNLRTEEVKAFRLHDRLKQEKNMLLILDDLWEELDLVVKVGIPFADVEKYSNENEGCKILLTSRNEALLSHRMKCQKIIKVGVLSNDEAWELLKSIAKLSVESSSSDLKSTATEIVQMCGGLPLAIATAAKALQGKDLDGWKRYLARLKHPLSRSVTGIKEVDTIMRLSYDPLSRENKDIFLLSSMLSHNPSIEDLVMYCVGLDILKHTTNMEDTRSEISMVVSKLKSLNLFLDSFSSNRFTIHDVWRDLALSIASDEWKAVIARHRRLNGWPDEYELEHCRGICLQESDMNDLPEELWGPILEFFLLNSKKSDLTIPNMFFKSSKKLKLLAFTNVHFSSLPSLSSLQKLKVLWLHSCLLEDITEVRSLRNLKVLSLAYSKIQRLPIEVAELTSLQMFNLSHCSNLEVIPQKLLSRLKKLEVLYMKNSFDQWKVEVSSDEADENASLDELKHLPISSLDIRIPNVSMVSKDLFLHMKLDKYRILIGKQSEWGQVNDETSKILRLELQKNVDLTGGIQKLLEGVEDLGLYGSNGHENILYSRDVRGFPCLKHLQIHGDHDIKYVVLNSAQHEDAFQNLESLKLNNLKALEKLCEGPDVVKFRQLHSLEMNSLRALTGDLCMKDRGTNNTFNKIFKSLFNNKVLFPKLEILKLSYLNRWIALIWDDQLSHNSFSNLKTLIVESCGFVKLVPLHVLKALNKLEELRVRNCDMLETVFDFEDVNAYKEIVPSPVVAPMKILQLESLPKLKNVWSNHHQGNVSIPSLRSVKVFRCESLTSIFPASIAKDMLRDLEELRIDGCGGIDVIVAKDQIFESVAVKFEFHRLTSLKLYRLSNLRKFYPQKHTIEWPHLQKLSIQACCDEFEIFEKEVSSSSEIYEEDNSLDSKYPLLSLHKGMHKLEELILSGKQGEMMGSGQFPMYHFPKVKLLHLSANKATTISYKTLLESFPKLEDLRLGENFVKALGEDDVTAHVARSLTLTLSFSLTKRSLSPSLVSPSHVTHLRMEQCNHLTTLMTSSTARSLIHLTSLSIFRCSQIEEIITKPEGEDDEDKEIIFNKLKFLQLYDSPDLKRFCGYNYTFKFPLLDKLIITACSKFKLFSPGLIHTPSLKSVQICVQISHWGEYHELLDTNLSKTFYQQRFVSSRELVLDELDARMIRDDQFPTERCPKVEILGIERFVDVWVTFPYALLERFPKLNELHVKQSSFKEIFPSHAPSSTLFHNLIVLKVSKCHQLFYLVTSSTAKSLVNLETLEIDDCEKMEEIIRKEPHDQLLHNLFSNLKTLIVKRCDFMKLVPLHVLKSLKNLEKLEVSDCDKLEKLFGFESSSEVLPLNLKHLEVNWCHGLTTLMTSRAAPSLVHLTHISICGCGQLVEIITKQEGEDDENKDILFDKLECLKFDRLERLKRFCGYNYTFSFQLLEQVTIKDCFQLTMFCPGAIHAPRLQSVRVNEYPQKDIWMTNLNNTIQHLFTFEEVISTTKSIVLDAKNIIMVMDVFPRVRCLVVESFQNEGVTFPYRSLERFPNLSHLYVKHSSFEGIFPSQDEIIDFMGKIPSLKGLVIAYLDKLKSIWNDDSQLPPIHQTLRVLRVENCCSLVKLAPSSASFQNLETLIISKCHQLIHLVTTSIAKSLVSLVSLKINDCKNMEEIVMNETSEDVEGGITFTQLGTIRLTDMPNLKLFSSQIHTFEFPESEEIEISRCPKMKMFCRGVLKTPKLSKVKIDEYDMKWKNEGDLNKTMEGLSLAKDSVNI